MTNPTVQGFFDHDTWTVTYVVYDEKTKDAVVIDPVLDYDALASQTGTKSADQVLAFIAEKHLHLRAVLETHAHADHISAARYITSLHDVPVVVGEDIRLVQQTFAKFFNIEDQVSTDGSQFDVLLKDGETARYGSIELKALATPGHTPACMSFLIGDAVFTGDALFMEDYGTGRTDFPAGSAKMLYQSIQQRLYTLPDSTRVFVGHDYQPGGRDVRFESTIGVQKESNVQLPAARSEQDFVTFRTTRDAGLRPPRLIFQSIQINVFGGLLPHEEDNGRRYLKMPLNNRVPTNDAGAPALQGAAE